MARIHSATRFRPPSARARLGPCQRQADRDAVNGVDIRLQGLSLAAHSSILKEEEWSTIQGRVGT